MVIDSLVLRWVVLLFLFSLSYPLQVFAHTFFWYGQDHINVLITKQIYIFHLFVHLAFHWLQAQTYNILSPSFTFFHLFNDWYTCCPSPWFSSYNIFDELHIAHKAKALINNQRKLHNLKLFQLVTCFEKTLISLSGYEHHIHSIP